MKCKINKVTVYKTTIKLNKGVENAKKKKSR